MLLMTTPLPAVAWSDPPMTTSLSLARSGAVTLRVNGVEWLRGGPTSVCAFGACYSTDQGTLLLVDNRSSSGHDALGTYASETLVWQAQPPGFRWETSLRTYDDNLFVLSQRWPDGCSNCSGAVNARDDVQSAFPTFVSGPTAGPTINFLSWGANQLSESTIGRFDLAAAARLRRTAGSAYPPQQTYVKGCNYTYQTKCPLVYPYFNGTWVGGAEHGAPLVLYDAQLSAVVLSPLRNFLVAEHTISPRLGHAWAAGLNGLVEELPRGFVHESVLAAGPTVTRAMRRWGDALLRQGGKARGEAQRRDATLHSLGYWTDRGSYYYGQPDARHPAWTMEDTLRAVDASMRAARIPVRYYQLDDWWFNQSGGDFGGMASWAPLASKLPSADLAKVLPRNPPLALYMGLISADAAATYPAAGLRLDGRFAVPTPNSSLYRDLFAGLAAANVSMILFEQDFLSYWLRLPLLQRDAFAGEAWLRQEAEAAAAANASVQYCMNLPASVLASTRLASVSQARASKDHTRDPLEYTWKVGLAGLLLGAVGLAASVDNVWSGADEPGGGGNCSEPSPDYELALAALSGGPVGLSDGLGFAERPRALAACDAGGTLLRPDEPLALTDGALRLSFEPPAELDVWAAYSTVGARRYAYVLSTYLPAPGVALGAGRDLGLAAAAHVAWDKQSSLDGALWSRGRRLDAARPLELRGCPAGANPRRKGWLLTVVAPLLSAACALVFAGELNKTVAVSSARFDAVACAADAQAVEVAGRGVGGEVLLLGVARAVPPFSILARQVVVGADGRFSAALRA